MIAARASHPTLGTAGGLDMKSGCSSSKPLLFPMAARGGTRERRLEETNVVRRNFSGRGWALANQDNNTSVNQDETT